MPKINIENKAFTELEGIGSLSRADMAVALNLRTVLVADVYQVSNVASKLAKIEAGLNNGEVRRAIDLMAASGHGDLLRERTVDIEIQEDGHAWEGTGLLIDVVGYLSVYETGTQRVFEVMRPEDLAESNYGMMDVVDSLSRVILVVENEETLDSELTDENGMLWNHFDQAWAGDEIEYGGEDWDDEDDEDGDEYWEEEDPEDWE